MVFDIGFYYKNINSLLLEFSENDTPFGYQLYTLIIWLSTI